jgi:hypothetical protein
VHGDSVYNALDSSSSLWDRVCSFDRGPEVDVWTRRRRRRCVPCVGRNISGGLGRERRRRRVDWNVSGRFPDRLYLSFSRLLSGGIYRPGKVGSLSEIVWRAARHAENDSLIFLRGRSNLRIFISQLIVYDIFVVRLGMSHISFLLVCSFIIVEDLLSRGLSADGIERADSRIVRSSF